MKNQTETIRKFVTYLNNREAEGGYWLPNIQRPFVWKEEQIERLYDSIMRKYPIGTLLVWKTKQNVKRREFIKYYEQGADLSKSNVPADEQKKMLVLDGQQRLQSLFIGLLGKFNGKELAMNMLSGEANAPDDIKYQFRFLLPEKIAFPFVKFSTLVYSNDYETILARQISKSANIELTDENTEAILRNVSLVKSIFCDKELLLFQEIDSIDQPQLYKEDDVLEIFIRANSGGTLLSKSDLMFSLLNSSWEDAEENTSVLLHQLNKPNYKFTRDFILKTCLVLLNQKARYNVDKLRNEQNQKNINDNWDKIANSMMVVKQFLHDHTFLKTDSVINSYLSLLPLIYVHYHYPQQWSNQLRNLEEYILRTSLSKAFSGTPDNLLDKLIRQINEDQGFNLKNIFARIREDGRSLEISRDIIIKANSWRKDVNLILNLWYGSAYAPAFRDGQLQVDYVFPEKILKKIREGNTEGTRRVMKYPKWSRDRIGNLRLLTQQESTTGNLDQVLPEEWLKDQSDEYLDLHLIPKDRTLWTLDNYEQFVDARTELIIQKFSYLLIKEE